MVAIEHAMNVFFRAEALMPVIEGHGVLSINRAPLAMGVLGGLLPAAHAARLPIAEAVRQD